MSGADWGRVLAIPEMYSTLLNSGWTKEDLRKYTSRSKFEHFETLDAFAEGQLSRAKGSPVFPVLLEATALRHAMHTTQVRSPEVFAPSECPHGFRMMACNQCLRGIA